MSYFYSSYCCPYKQNGCLMTLLLETQRCSLEISLCPLQRKEETHTHAKGV